MCQTSLFFVDSFILADRTNGRTIGTVLRMSSVTLCIVAKRCVLEQKLLLRAFIIGSRIWAIDWYQNEWPWSLLRGRIKVTSTIALHLTLNILETVKIEAWFQRTTNSKWHVGYRMVTLRWPMTLRDLERSNSWPQYA